MSPGEAQQMDCADPIVANVEMAACYLLSAENTAIGGN